MARDSAVVDSHRPSAIAPATPAIAHVQLRDLLICPREMGVVNYVVPQGIVEQDLRAPGAPIQTIAKLNFTPNSLTSLPVGQDDTLIAAGGQEAEIHLSYYTSKSSSRSNSTSETQRKTRMVWEFQDHLPGSINNSVLLTSLSLTKSNESSVEPRVGVSNNDGTIRLYDVPLRVQKSRRKLREVGIVMLDVPINHSSISPDGRTLLSVGDSNKVYFHQISGGSRISFTPITTLTIPPPDTTSYPSTSLTAAFSTAFSGDGSKFAVASQEGVVAVWDVRSTRPLKVFYTDKSRGIGPSGLVGNGGASGWLSDEPWEWTRGTKAPGWCVRSVKFNGGEGGRMGKEVMAFTEHTSLVHLVDARTFEIHDIIRVPTLQRPKSMQGTRSWLRAHTSAPPSTATSNTRSASSRRDVASNSATAGSSTGSGALLQRRRTLIRRGFHPTSHARLVRPDSTSNAREERGGEGDGTTRSTIQRGWHGFLPSPPASFSAPPSPSSPLRSAPAAEGPRVHLATRRATRTAAAANFIAGINNLASETRGPARTTTSSRSESPTLRAHTPGIVQALGDAFRIPGIGVPPSSPPRPTSSGSATYSPPASIGDSTWRTLGGGVGGGPSRATTTTTTTSQPSTTPPWARLVGLAPEPSEERHDRGDDDDGEDDEEGMTVDEYDASTHTAHPPDDRWGTRLDQVEGGDFDDPGDGGGLVVVPDLGDRDVESDVRALLAVHGIQSRTPEGSAGESNDNGSAGEREDDEAYRPYIDLDRFMDDFGLIENEPEHAQLRSAMRAAFGPGRRREELQEEGDRMDVDVNERRHGDDEAEEEEVEEEEEHDAEYISDEDGSRSGSPFNVSRRIRSSGLPSWRLASPTSRGHTPTAGENKPSHASLASSMGNTATRKYGYYDDLDIAGICFDPWGERMYVAGVGGGVGSFGGSMGSGDDVGVGAVVEWGVRGAEKRWWVDDGGWR